MSTEKWVKYKLNDVIDVFIDYRGKTPTKSESGVPLITAKVVKNGRIEVPNEFIPEKDFENWMTRGLPEIGDVVLTTEAPLGEVAQIDIAGKVALAQRIITMRGKKGVLDNSFLKYAFQTDRMQERLSGRATGTTVTGIKSSELREIEIELPDFSTQRRIAAILTALDDKIELNRRMNETLEGIAKALWGEWFGKTDASELIELGDLVEFNPQISIALGDEVVYVEMKDVPERGMCISGFVQKPFTSGSKFSLNDTLLARITPCLENGKTAFVNFMKSSEKAFGSTEFIVMRAKEGISPYFVYFIAREENFRQFAINSMVGSSGRQRVQTEVLPLFEIAKPNADDMARFHKFAAPIFEYIHQNALQSRTLTTMRDGLLPRLMRGEF